MIDFPDAGRPVPTHYGVLIHLGDPTGASGGGPQITWIASGDESTCWVAIKQWTTTHRLRAGEHAEVLARTSEPHRSVAVERDRVADQREEIADERERIADERERIADEREGAADERDRDIDRRQAELSERVRVVEATFTNAMASSSKLLADTQTRLARTKAALERSRDQRVSARRQREPAGIDRQLATTRRAASSRDRTQPTPPAIPDHEQPDTGTAARNGIRRGPGTP